MRAWIALTLLFLAACDSKDRQDGALSQSCAPRQPATGKIEKVSHPDKPSSCMVVVMSCNYCEYSEDGTFSHSGSEVCGVCVGLDN